MNRRDFIVGASSATLFTAASYGRILGSNDRLGIALVGCGRRGRWVLDKMMKTQRITPIVFCDVWNEPMKKGINQLGLGKIPMVYDLEEVLSNAKVDAVLLATPDHLHTQYASRILKAKKHLYLEKPVTLHFEEGSSLEAFVNESGMLCQTGTQQRSGAHYQRVKEEFFGGADRLGDILFVRSAWSDFGWQRRVIDPRSKPKNFNWETFLGPAPKIPYEWSRYDAWRNYKEYGAGILSDLLTHWGDVAQWMMDDHNPKSAVTVGGIYHLKDGRSNPDTVNTIIQYEGGWNFTFECSVLPVKNQKDSVLFHGTKAKLEVFRAGYIYTPHGQSPIHVENTTSLDDQHVANFLNALTKGEALNAPVSVGLQAVKPSHLATSAYWSGKRMTFNSAQTEIIEQG